jgi:hypothetical protein
MLVMLRLDWLGDCAARVFAFREAGSPRGQSINQLMDLSACLPFFSAVFVGSRVLHDRGRMQGRVEGGTNHTMPCCRIQPTDRVLSQSAKLDGHWSIQPPSTSW